MPKGIRASYNPYEMVLKDMEKMEPDVLRGMKHLDFCKRTKRKIHVAMFGKLRKQVLKGGGDELNGISNSGDLLVNVAIVSKTAKKVGGLNNLAMIVSFLEKVKEL